MKRALIGLQALDTWWFREGRLFEQMDDGLAEAESIFPPSPATISGAVALALARANSNLTADVAGQPWSELSKNHPFLADVTALAGVGPGRISATGPFLLRGHELFVPMPPSLALNDEYEVRILLPRPLQGAASGLGNEPLLVQTIPIDERPTDLEEFKATTDCWLRWNEFVSHALDIEQAQGKKIDMDAWFATATAVRKEPRIGIGTDAIAGTASDGQLYAASHIRPSDREPQTREFSLAIQLDCREGQLPPTITSPFTLGGKGRLADAKLHTNMRFGAGNPKIDIDKWDFDQNSKQLCLRLIAVTPVPVAEDRDFGLPSLTGPFEGLTPLAAVLPRPKTIGLWRWNEGPRLIRVFPAGSTWFVQLPTKNTPKKDLIPSLWKAAFGQRLGPSDLAAQGFGAFVVGNWPSHSKRKAGK